MKKLNVAIVGVGAVGDTFLKVFEEKNFPIKNLKILATKKSEGKKIIFRGNEYTVEETKLDRFKGIDLVFFAGGSDSSKFYAKDIVKLGGVIIDNSSFFRLKDYVPLIVPEVNPNEIKKHKGIIANPNCSTIQMCVALKPINDFSKIKKVIVSTYQSVSGAGQKAMDELISQTDMILKNKKINIKVFPYQIAFNLIPHIDIFLDNYYSREEIKLQLETQKIFGNKQMKISATAVRVPILRSHSEAITIETEEKITRNKALSLFRKNKNIIVEDDLEKNIYPMPITVSNKDEVYIGRIREDIAFDNGLSFFVVADQLRKGAATNAIQIAELLLNKNII